MIFYLTSLVCCLVTVLGFARNDLIPSTPEQTATLNCDPESSIGNLIDPLSGQPGLRVADLIVNGAQKITLNRTYIPSYVPSSFPKTTYNPEFYKYRRNPEKWDRYHLYSHLKKHLNGWRFCPHSKLAVTENRCANVCFPNGTVLSFRCSDSKLTSSYALTNLRGEMPNGKHDLKNTDVSIKENGTRIVIRDASGAIRFYVFARREAMLTPWERHLFGNIRDLYTLEKERLPNGKILRYHYNNHNLVRIESLDPKERFIYSSISVNQEGSTKRLLPSSGQNAAYNYAKIVDSFLKIQHKKEGEIGFNFMLPDLLSSISSPFYRHESISYNDKMLLSSYSGKDATFTIGYAGFGRGTQHYRVHQLFFPVGKNNNLQAVHTLYYDPPIAGKKAGGTTVQNSDGSSTKYHFSKEFLKTLVQHFDCQGQLKKEKAYTWNKNNYLQSLEVRDGNGHIFYKKTYEYDTFGNPTKEALTGLLTGEEDQDSHTITRIFSKDGFQNLLEEHHESGKTYHYTYLPNTNLPTAKLTSNTSRILRRNFFFYDDCHNLIQSIQDDGSSSTPDDLEDVTERRIHRYRLKQEAPFLHMPECIEETYLDKNGDEQPLTKKHLTYDQNGNIAAEEIYDANGAHVYTIEKTYNERGDILTETNSIGQCATTTYDARGHVTQKTSFSGRRTTTYTYDLQGRVLTETIEGDDGITHTYTYFYDFHDRLIQSIDPLKNITTYTHDPIAHKITTTTAPAIENIEGSPSQVTFSSTYNALGHETTTTNALGHTTTYTYNAYGSPLKITYPDGSLETYTYYPDGRQKTHTDPDGHTTKTTRDIFDRVLTKTLTSSDNQTTIKETTTYTPFRPITHTDAEGYITVTTYDGAGRKIASIREGKKTTYTYDSLSRQETITDHNKESTLITHYTYDLLDHILTKTATDLKGNPLSHLEMTYDADGNKNTITRTINGKKATQTRSYDSMNRLIETRDPLNFITTITYDETSTNTLGQHILTKITTNPQGTKTTTTYDPFDRITSKTKHDANQTPLSHSHYTYDPEGNQIARRDLLYSEGKHIETQTTLWTYTPQNTLATETRAANTSHNRLTTWTYTPTKKIKTKTLPNGVTLAYAYHPLGFRTRLTSSDNQIDNTYTYNNLGHLLKAHDHALTIQREVDPFGNTLSETFPSGHTVTKTYDLFDRTNTLTLDPQTTITYTYDPLHLKTVTRSGSTTYTHSYDTYDQSGNLLQETPINSQTPTTYTYDLNASPLTINSPTLTQTCHYDPLGNLDNETLNNDNYHYTYDPLMQLTSEQGPFHTTYTSDSLYNHRKKNNYPYAVNPLNETTAINETHYTYDLNGNRTQDQNWHYTYDPLNRLTKAENQTTTITFIYDPLGRRLQKTTHTISTDPQTEIYLYDNNDEIATLDPAKSKKTLKVLGILDPRGEKRPIAIELDTTPFCPVLDTRCNIRHLLHPGTTTPAASYTFTAFGETTTTNPHLNNPYTYAAKRYDPDLNLFYFNKRYYDPNLAKWLTTDPLGAIDSPNLYQYAFNNPFFYSDPEGTSAISPFALSGSVSLYWGACAATGPAGWVIAGAAVAYIGYEVYKSNTHLPSFGNSNLPSNPNSNLPQKGGPGLSPMLGPIIAGVSSIAAQVFSQALTRKTTPYSGKVLGSGSKQHSPDQQALSELSKDASRKGISKKDADTLIEWGKEYDFPNTRDDRGKSHWVGGEHIHLGREHIPVRD